MIFETQCGESPVAPTYLRGAESGQQRSAVKFENGSDKIPVGRRRMITVTPTGYVSGGNDNNVHTNVRIRVHCVSGFQTATTNRKESNMEDSEMFWLGIWALVCIAFCTLVITVGLTTYAINNSAFEHGYEAASLPGMENGKWVKVK